MTRKAKTIHLICNAHLDPVWLWQWQEGAAEAISTFRVSAELCEKDNAFIFNHNEVTLYKWVQEYESQLFKRIQKLVKQGKWHIMGGWHLQPDCNMPSGESFVRQILLGKNYFKAHFGVEPTTAINFDPFGHSRGLVQILAKSGYDSYLFLRPLQEDIELPADEFIWKGFDGSEIMACRPQGWYNSFLGKAREKVEKWMELYSDKRHCVILWGVGNHGGGPSKKDLRQINKYIAANKEFDVRHSTPEMFFKEVAKSRYSLPVHAEDLNPWAVGCYTSQIRIKQKQRLLENEIYSLEKAATAASLQGLMKYPAEEIQTALEDMAVGQFHDILPGSSIQPVEEDSLRLLDHGLEITSRLKARAFFALSAGEPKAKEGTIPIMVFNPHPYKVFQEIECEFQLQNIRKIGDYADVIVCHKGRPIPSQVEKELSNIPADWRKRVVFRAELAAGQMNRFDCKTVDVPPKTQPKLKRRRDNLYFKSNDLEVVINTQTGLIDRYIVNGCNIIDAGGFEPIIMKDNQDSWGMLDVSYRETIGRFKLMDKKRGSAYSGVTEKEIDSVRVIEDGAVRTVIEAVFSCADSFICQRYKLPKKGAEIEVEILVHWNEKDSMLKLSTPFTGVDAEYLGQTAYGVQKLPNNGNEAVAQKWTAVVDRKNDLALTCINDGVYGSDYSNDGLRLTLLRSPMYACHPTNVNGKPTIITAQDRYSPRCDQGQRRYRFWFNAGKINERLKHIDREALIRNETVLALSFFPPGGGKKAKPAAVLSDDVIQATAIKRAEKGNAIIIRLFEPTGRKRNTALSLPTLKKKINLTFNPFEIKTLKINAQTGKCSEVNLLEKPIK